MKNNWIDNKIVIITGASSGIGYELAKKLITKHNCRIIGVGRSENKMLGLSAILGAKKELFSYRLFDVSINENWREFYNYLNDNNIYPDVLINNAGYLLPFSKFESYSAFDAENIIAVNYLSVVYSCRTLLPLLKNSAVGAIINISSSSSLAPVVGNSLYSASKSAVKGFTECLIEDYRKELYISCVYPGFTKTNIFQKQKSDISENKIIAKVCSPLDTTVDKMLKKILRKKRRVILGADAKAMCFFYKFMPVSLIRAITVVLEKSKLKIFDDVFKNK